MRKAILVLVPVLMMNAALNAAEPDILWTFETGG